MYQELIDENDYNGLWCDERVYLDLRASADYTSEEAKLERNDSKISLLIQLKKLRLRAWAYSLGEYFLE